MVKLTAADFEAWRGSPLTEFFFDRFIEAEKARTRAAHADSAWEGALTDEIHGAMRERWEVLSWLQSLDYEDLRKWLEEQQNFSQT